MTRFTLTQILGDLIDVLEVSHLTANHVNEVLDQTEEFLDVCAHLQQTRTGRVNGLVTDSLVFVCVLELLYISDVRVCVGA